jgi:uncharacterized cupredoxin-like copper-binding protein
MKTDKAFVMMLVLMVLILSACSSNAPAAMPPVAATPTESPVDIPTAIPNEPPAVTAAKFPTGRFVSVNDGALAHQFNNDGTFAFLIGEVPVVQGTYRTEGDFYIELSNDDTDPKCQEHPTYKWSFDGNTLTFAPVSEDSCRGRREAFADTYKVMADSLPEITIDAADFSYTAPENVGSGWVRVNLTNSGQEPHHVQFLRLNDGVTMEQFQEALKQGEGPALALVSQVGGVGAVAPGGSAQSVINLPAGAYAILCFIPSPADQTPHFAKGMIKSLTVQEASTTSVNEPSADLTVRLKDFTFDMPASLPAGLMVIQVINDGPEPHELNLMRLEEGKDLQDALQFLTAPDGPPPFVPVGGMNGLDVGLSGYIEYDFQPGNYLAICNIPSPKAEGHPHFTLGMVKQFTVGSTEASN